MNKAKHALPSKKNAPKKTGKSGIKPLDEGKELLTTPTTGKQGRLPTMEEYHLEDLEEAALAYAAVRDERQALTRKEVDAKDILHTLMKRHDKKVYRVSEMTIEIVAKDETVKVKITKDKDED